MTGARIAELQAASDAHHRAYQDAVASIESELREITRRAEDIVRAGATISGHPARRDEIKAEIGPEVILVQVEKYIGNGEYSDGVYVLRFPTRWLAMPDSEWKAELAREVAATKERRAVEVARREEARREEVERQERETYARLRAKFAEEKP